MGKFYQCLQSYGPSFMTKFCSALYLENLLTNIFAKLNLRGGVSCMPAALLFNSDIRHFQDYFSSYETHQSVGGKKREYHKKKTWHPQAVLGLSHMWPVWGSNQHQAQR